MDIILTFQLSFWLMLILSSSAAWHFGARSERWGSIIMLLGAFASTFAVSTFANRFVHFEIGLALVDLGVLVGLCVLMLRSNRFWPVWASGLQLAGMLTHISVMLAPTSVPVGYALLQGFWAYPIIFSMLLGTYGHQRALRFNR